MIVSKQNLSLVLVFVSLITLVFEVNAQKFRNRKQSYSSAYSAKSQSIFPTTFDYNPSGWVIEPGLTYTFTRLGSKTKAFGDTLSVEFKDKGTFRPYLGFGRFKILVYWYFFKFFDYGLAYMWTSGKERFTTNVNTSGTGKFSDHQARVYFNFTNI